jgi:RHH-type proline utilization regulon transcriptional repressor/proline dehydrogenase/delta 1-pyrroline-5-carboxylate dehydrogenase
LLVDVRAEGATAMPSISHEAAAATQQNLDRLLADFRPDPQSSQTVEVQQAVYLARSLGQRARALQSPQERRQQAELDRMIHSPGDKATLMQLTDQAFRSNRARRAADQLIHILDVQGVPRFFSALDRTLLKGFQSFGAYLPGVALPLIQEKIEHETANVILPAERELLAGHLKARWEEGVRMNVNLLGEALLGERQAERRLHSYLALLDRPEIEVISVKISTIYSQISPLARRHTVDVLCDRLELLLRAAARATFERRDGNVVPKFVYLDMERYPDMELTAEAFMRTLDRPGLEQARAGIALQAYIPDSFAVQRRINDWARRRAATGGSPVMIRVVKGANIEMERVEASLNGWPQAPFKTKRQTDANCARMLVEGMRPENLAAVHLGIASHNLFTLAYGLVLAARAGALDRVQFEMLEGMANHQRRALFELTRNMLLYAPACRRDDFTSAIGYLVRRLDENTGPDNFLHHAFRIEVGSPTWQSLEQQFLDSFAATENLPSTPRRKKGTFYFSDAVAGVSESDAQKSRMSPFSNEPPTDWSLPANSRWGEEIFERWHPRCDQRAADVPLVVAGKESSRRGSQRDSLDPSRPGVVVARYSQATESDIDRAVACARTDKDDWRTRPVAERSDVLRRAADELCAARGELMGAMLAEAGKTLAEGDLEVSEAIDYCRFYAQTAECFHEVVARSPDRATSAGSGDPRTALVASGRGVVVVVSPWNFPLAIPCGDVAAALAAGNTVILKPASDTVLVAYLLCQCFWRAGVSMRTLQFASCEGGTVGQRLVAHGDVDAVILTGGTVTAAAMLAAKPTIRLFAETGGKNVTIVTGLADRELATAHVLHSAFSHSGQKCSATSLMILEREVYHDEGSRELFCDAVESLPVGSAWDLATKVGPLIRPPAGVLETALKELEPGEEWAVRPRLRVDGNPNLVSPGVKWQVRPDSVTHCTELFGPLLGVMDAVDLDEAIELVNATGYGLTSGLESLDDREQRLWQQHIRAGNLYINRPTTGAVVLRQPFGGMGKSAIGPGVKAGGPNYVVPLMTFDDAKIPAGNELDSSREPTDRRSEESTDSREPMARRCPAEPNWPRPASLIPTSRQLLAELFEGLEDAAEQATGAAADEMQGVLRAIESYDAWAEREFHQLHDHFRLLGQDNFRRYLPVDLLTVRVHPSDTFRDVFCRAAAARAAGCRLTISLPPGLSGPPADALRLLDELTDTWAGAIEFLDQTDARLADAIRGGQVDRVRYAAPDRVPTVIRQAAAESLQYIADAPVVAHGRVELLWYMREQSLTVDYHRYGNLGIRAGEDRAEPA